jgi:hypothetical protein
MSELFNDEISGGRQRPGHRAVAWVTLAVLGAVAVGGGAYAATRGGGGPASGAAAQLVAATTSPSPSASPRTDDGRPGPMMRGPMMRGPHGPMLNGPITRGMLGIGGQLLHGEATVQGPDGKTQIVDTQRGAISSLDSAAKSLTVTSTDKVSFTYLTDSDTRFVVLSAGKPGQATFADLKQGDTVEIVAIRSGDTRTAKSVVDGMPTIKDHKGWPGPGHRPGAPSPSASASASGTSA